MVAISLYRGNLHKVPDVPRRWLMPARKINLHDFKTLLHRRNRALSRLLTPTPTPTPPPPPPPNPNPSSSFGGNKDGNFKEFGEVGSQKIGNKDGGCGNKDGNCKEIGKNGDRDGIFEEIRKNGNKDGNFKKFGEMGSEKIGNKDGDWGQISEDGYFKEDGKNRDVDGIFEEIGKNGNKDGNFMEIGKNGCGKIWNRDGNCKEIGGCGCVKSGDRDGKLKKIGGNGIDEKGNKNGKFEEIGKKGWEKNGKKDGSWGENGNNGYVNKVVEIGELVEEEGNGKGGGEVEKVVEASELMVVEGKDGVVGIKANDLDGGGVARIDQEEEMKVEKAAVTSPSLEIAKKEEVVSDKQKRKQEIEEKLKILNEKKHSLVQALKQILNAEEELKRRSNTQGVAGQPLVGGGQVEGTRDSGSTSRHNTPIVGSEGNVSGEADRAETGDANHNVHLRHLVRTSSTSPSSDTQQRKSPFVTATFPSRTNSGVANSPSRFALTGQQGLPPNLQSVSVSGTNYAASSPSPAANGGTSAFRDKRVPSPWS